MAAYIVYTDASVRHAGLEHSGSCYAVALTSSRGTILNLRSGRIAQEDNPLYSSLIAELHAVLQGILAAQHLDGSVLIRTDCLALVRQIDVYRASAASGRLISPGRNPILRQLHALIPQVGNVPVKCENRSPLIRVVDRHSKMAHGCPEEKVKEYLDKARSGDYDHLLATTTEYCEVH